MTNSHLVAFSSALLITLILLFLFFFTWYHIYGWTTFSFAIGDDASWTARTGKDIRWLRFKDCVFTVTPTGGTAKTLDVTTQLNTMAKAYMGMDGTIKNPPTVLSLSRNLNPFSFVLTGFNDTAANITTSKISATPVSCSSDSACPFGTVKNACGPTGYCVNATGLATVTLTGRYKTL
jgi:hypothetical protein